MKELFQQIDDCFEDCFPQMPFRLGTSHNRYEDDKVYYDTDEKTKKSYRIHTLDMEFTITFDNEDAFSKIDDMLENAIKTISKKFGYDGEVIEKERKWHVEEKDFPTNSKKQDFWHQRVKICFQYKKELSIDNKKS